MQRPFPGSPGRGQVKDKIVKQANRNLRRSVQPWAALATIAFITLALAGGAQAQQVWWTGAVNSNYNTVGNWSLDAARTTLATAFPNGAGFHFNFSADGVTTAQTVLNPTTGSPNGTWTLYSADRSAGDQRRWRNRTRACHDDLRCTPPTAHTAAASSRLPRSICSGRGVRGFTLI
jgi:hypothetical protein